MLNDQNLVAEIEANRRAWLAEQVAQGTVIIRPQQQPPAGRIAQAMQSLQWLREVWMQGQMVNQ